MTPRSPAAQDVHSAPRRHAIFLVATLNPGPQALAQVRHWAAGIADLTRAVHTRAPEAALSCVCAFGTQLWDALSDTRPAQLHPFREFSSDGRLAPSTPGDVLLHIRGDSMDMCFELATHLLEPVSQALMVVDETHGFRYFDRRALIGFVDGTENPEGEEAAHFTLIGDEDAAFAGGSYVMVQKYLHDMTAWNALPVEQQERIIGRRKQSNIELDDDSKPSWSHVALTNLEQDGQEIKILRDNLPFGRPGSAEFGTYFIGYARSPAPMEQMLENMVVGVPAGNYDRLLDFSRAVTGGLFFVPSVDLLESLAD